MGALAFALGMTFLGAPGAEGSASLMAISAENMDRKTAFSLDNSPRVPAHSRRPPESPTCAGLPPDGGHFLIVGRAEPPAGSGLATLRYTEVDVQNMREVGERLFCFGPNQITTLTGPEATAERVLAILAGLTPKARGGRLGRLFVYFSAHGSQTEGVLLDRALPGPVLFEAITAVGARQTFTFLDACESASMEGLPKGSLGLAPGWDEGHLYLAASAGITRENSRLRGGQATQDFLGAVYDLAGRGPVRSPDLCRYLHQSGFGALQGGCSQHLRGGDGVVLVPDPRPPGYLEVEVPPRSGPWLYLLAPLRDGRPVGGFPARTPFRGERLGLPPGDWQVRRVPDARQDCGATQVVIVSGETTTVHEQDWGPDGRYCRGVERVEQRPTAGISRALAWSVGDAQGERMARVGLSQQFEAGRLGVAVQASLRSVTPWAASPVRELALVGAWDPFVWPYGELDTWLGFELGGGLDPSSRRPMAAGAVRLGWRARLSRWWQPELVGHLGAHRARQTTLRLGLSVGVHHDL